jgi:hypothetical protein
MGKKYDVYGKIPGIPPRFMGRFKSKKEAGTYTGIYNMTEVFDGPEPKWFYKKARKRGFY